MVSMWNYLECNLGLGIEGFIIILPKFSECKWVLWWSLYPELVNIHTPLYFLSSDIQRCQVRRGSSMLLIPVYFMKIGRAGKEGEGIHNFFLFLSLLTTLFNKDWNPENPPTYFDHPFFSVFSGLVVTSVKGYTWHCYLILYFTRRN